MFILLELPLCPPLLLLIVLLPPWPIVLLHFVDAFAGFALVTLVAVAAKPISELLQVFFSVPPFDSDISLSRRLDFVAFVAQV